MEFFRRLFRRSIGAIPNGSKEDAITPQNQAPEPRPTGANSSDLGGVATLSLVGCPTHDLADLHEGLQALRMNLRPAGVVQDGDYVVFCVSCTDGPTQGTRAAVDRCTGHVVVPLAVVLTRAELVDDDSLRELLKCEELELLCRVMPRAVVERLPLYYDFDPGLPGKLNAIIAAGINPVTCGR